MHVAHTLCVVSRRQDAEHQKVPGGAGHVGRRGVDDVREHSRSLREQDLLLRRGAGRTHIPCSCACADPGVGRARASRRTRRGDAPTDARRQCAVARVAVREARWVARPRCGVDAGVIVKCPVFLSVSRVLPGKLCCGMSRRPRVCACGHALEGRTTGQRQELSGQARNTGSHTPAQATSTRKNYYKG